MSGIVRQRAYAPVSRIVRRSSSFFPFFFLFFFFSLRLERRSRTESIGNRERLLSPFSFLFLPFFGDGAPRATRIGKFFSRKGGNRNFPFFFPLSLPVIRTRTRMAASRSRFFSPFFPRSKPLDDLALLQRTPSFLKVPEYPPRLFSPSFFSSPQKTMVGLHFPGTSLFFTPKWVPSLALSLLFSFPLLCCSTIPFCSDFAPGIVLYECWITFPLLFSSPLFFSLFVRN